MKAVEGKWKTIVTLPMEIENNYSPALISLYASDSKGREANGHTEQFYVYGFNDNISGDNEGLQSLNSTSIARSSPTEMPWRSPRRS